MKLINIRGCNGSGKTTLLRRLAGKSPSPRLAYSVTHTAKNPKTGKKEIMTHPPIPVTALHRGYAILGDYTEAAASATTAGCDRIKTQEAVKKVLVELVGNSLFQYVFFEGVVVSTIYGPWKEFAAQHGGMVWAFLDTPLSVCLDQIQERNGGKAINTKLVVDKYNTIRRVREKALRDGLEVWDLSYKTPLTQLLAYLGERDEH